MPHIFDRFYQVDDSHTREGGGTGIGLTFVRELVELMGGHIHVKSTPGNGSEFTLRLPLQQEAPLREVQFSAKENPSPFRGRPLEPTPERAAPDNEEQAQLLIIEDNPDVVLYVRSCLQEYYQIEVAENGAVGIEKALELVPDIIISDVMMPGKDGFEVCTTLKNDERTSHIPIVLLTAKADFESRIEGLERGADAYLAKPFEKRELLVRLHQLLELRRRLQKRYADGAVPVPSKDKDIQIEDAFL